MPDIFPDILIRGIAIGLLAAVGASIARAPAPPAQRIAGVFFSLAVIGYVTQEPDELTALLGPVAYVFWFLAVLGTGALWLFILMLFTDPPRLRMWHAIPFFGLLAIALTGAFGVEPWRWYARLGHNGLEAVLILHAVAVILRGRQEDLIEERRDLRVWFLIAIAGFALSISVVESIGLYFQLPDLFLNRLAGSLIALTTLIGAVLLLQVRTLLFAPPLRPVAAPDGPASADAPAKATDPDRLALSRILALVDEKQIWRQEGLTIGKLADAAGLPEHQARRLINTRLGHRNFSEFVNARRIKAAQQALADPARMRTTVAEIAFELGFGSLGPFNRAFREATGQTPTVWRRAAHAAAGRNPESLADSENAKDS
jgi:AraC-like DNA-binding protein